MRALVVVLLTFWARRKPQPRPALSAEDKRFVRTMYDLALADRRAMMGPD